MSPGEIISVILACAPSVAPGTVQSVIDVESRGNVLAIGVNRGGRLDRPASTLADAIAVARRLRAAGVNFDAGLMQINSSNWARLGLTPDTVFDPCTNVRAGARILTENYSRASRELGHGRPALLAALSAYNTGNMRAGFRNGYVAKVSYAAAKRSGVPLPAPVIPAVSSAEYDWRTAPTADASGVAPAIEWSAPGTWGDDSPEARNGQIDVAFNSLANKDAY